MNQNTRALRQSSHRWWIPATIVIVAWIVQLVLWQVFAADRTYTKMSLLFVWPAAIFSLLLWWLFGSGFRWRIRAGVIGALALCGVVLGTVFRIDETDGDMVPVIKFAWEPRFQDRAREFWQQHDVQSAQPSLELPEVPFEVTADDWPGFRGPLRDGVVRQADFRMNWSEQPPVEMWRHPVGPGWGSFAVVDDFAFTQEQRDEQESIVCYRLSTGEQVWVHRDPVKFDHVLANGGPGPRATPTIEGRSLYAMGATGLLTCLDAVTGAKNWQRNTLVDAGPGPDEPAKNLEWGMSGSPLVVDELVVVTPGGKAGHGTIAYHKDRGEIAWSAGDHEAGYSSPRVETLCGVRQILSFYGDGIAGHRLDDGRELWFFPWSNDARVNAAQPIAIGDDSVLVASGYATGSTRLKLIPAAERMWSVESMWKSQRLKLKFNDAILFGDHVYGLDDGILSCMAVETGKTLWKKGRYNYGQLLLYGETLIVLSEAGDLVLVPATPKPPQELATFKALPEGITWNHPVLVRNFLLVRNGREAACFDVGFSHPR